MTLTNREKLFSRGRKKDKSDYNSMNRTPYQLLTKAYQMKNAAVKETEAEVRSFYYSRAGWWLNMYIKEMG